MALFGEEIEALAGKLTEAFEEYFTALGQEVMGCALRQGHHSKELRALHCGRL